MKHQPNRWTQATSRVGQLDLGNVYLLETQIVKWIVVEWDGAWRGGVRLLAELPGWSLESLGLHMQMRGHRLWIDAMLRWRWAARWQ